MKMFFTFVLHWQNTTTLPENKYYLSLSPRCFQFSFCEMNIEIISCWRMTVQMIWKKHKLNFAWQFCGNVREMWFNNVNCVAMSRCLCLCICCLYPQIYLCTYIAFISASISMVISSFISTTLLLILSKISYRYSFKSLPISALISAFISATLMPESTKFPCRYLW